MLGDDFVVFARHVFDSDRLGEWAGDHNAGWMPIEPSRGVRRNRYAGDESRLEGASSSQRCVREQTNASASKDAWKVSIKP